MLGLKVIAARFRNRKFTPAEICAMFGLTPVHVNNLIDEIVAVGAAHTGNRKRVVEYHGLSVLLLADQLVYCQLKPELRLEVLRQAARARTRRVTVPGTNLSALVEPYRKRAQEGMHRLHEAEEAVQSRKDVMQGEPCVRGTRIPVYVVAAIAKAKGRNEAVATYPSLTLGQIELAEMFAQAHPRRGRPKTTPLTSEGELMMTKIIKRSRAS